MNRSLLISVGALSLVALTSGQCALGDHPNCANWVRNGFCVNSAYSVQMKQQYCPKSCPETGCSGGGAATTTAPKVQNANCKKWNEDPANVFCGNEKITADQKKIFCFDTCKAEIANTDNCAVYIQATGATTVARKAEAGTVAPAPATSTKTTTGDKVLHAFAKNKCKLNLFAADTPELDPTAGTYVAPLETVDGSTADKYLALTAGKDALSYSCECTA